MTGLRSDVTREQFARAAVDGVACGLLDGLDALRGHADVTGRLVLVGGGARSLAVQKVVAGLARNVGCRLQRRGSRRHRRSGAGSGGAGTSGACGHSTSLGTGVSVRLSTAWTEVTFAVATPRYATHDQAPRTQSSGLRRRRTRGRDPKRATRTRKDPPSRRRRRCGRHASRQWCSPQMHSGCSAKGVSQRPSATGGGHEQETAAGSPTDDWFGTERDVPSFTVEALPAEAFEALLVARLLNWATLRATIRPTNFVRCCIHTVDLLVSIGTSSPMPARRRSMCQSPLSRVIYCQPSSMSVTRTSLR